MVPDTGGAAGGTDAMAYDAITNGGRDAIAPDAGSTGGGRDALPPDVGSSVGARDSSAPDAHKATAHYRAWRDAVAELMVEPRTSRRFTNVFPEDTAW